MGRVQTVSTNRNRLQVAAVVVAASPTLLQTPRPSSPQARSLCMRSAEGVEANAVSTNLAADARVRCRRPPPLYCCRMSRHRRRSPS
jgi:hypothetical protein